jgi:DnaJ-class molecular chaperone
MDDNYIYVYCPECRGDGIINRWNYEGEAPVDIDEPCTNCQDGLVLWGILKDELIGEE